MIEVGLDDLIELKDVPPMLPAARKGKPLSYETIRQWAKNGRRGVYLETRWVGGRQFTSKLAVKAFVDAYSQQRSPHCPPTGVNVQSSDAAARRVLDRILKSRK